MKNFPDRPFTVSLFTTDCERINDLELLCDNAMSDPELTRIAREICQTADARTLWGGDPDAGPWIRAETVLHYAHTYHYVPHPNGVEQFQPVLYTVETRQGNCEDLNGLCATLMRLCDVSSKLVWLNQKNAPLNHVSCLVYLYGTWYWAEASIRGASLGEDPYDAATRLERHDVTGGVCCKEHAAAAA